jgi:hypothetical protein
MTRYIYLILSSLFCFTGAFAQNSPPSIEWGKIHPITDPDKGTPMLITYIKKIKNGYLSYTGGYVILDKNFNLVSQHPLGYTGGSNSKGAKPVPGGGYIACFTTNAPVVYGNITLEPQGQGNDAAVVKYDDSFNIEWIQLYGGTAQESVYDITPTNDGGYIFVGYSRSVDGDLTGIKTADTSYSYYWITKIDADGDIEWQKAYGGDYSHKSKSGYYGYYIIKTSDGNFLTVGSIIGGGNIKGGKEDEGEIDFHGGTDTWVLKIDPQGNILWQKALGGSGAESIEQIIEHADGNYAVFMSTNSADIQDGEYDHEPKGGMDGWLVKLDKNEGTLLWGKSLGGKGIDQPTQPSSTKIDILPDGNIVTVMSTNSTELEGFNSKGGSYNIMINKINSNDGNVVWQKLVGIDNHIGVSPGNGYEVFAQDDGSIYVKACLIRTDTSVPFLGEAVDPSFTKHDYTDEKLSNWFFKLSKSLGLEDIDTATNRFVYYPNPVRDILHFGESVDAVEVYDLNGRKLLDKKGNAINSIDLSALPQGVYTLKVTQTNKKHRFKVIKK